MAFSTHLPRWQQQRNAEYAHRRGQPWEGHLQTRVGGVPGRIQGYSQRQRLAQGNWRGLPAQESQLEADARANRAGDAEINRKAIADASLSPQAQEMKRRRNLILGGMQPNEADKAIAGERKAAAPVAVAAKPPLMAAQNTPPPAPRPYSVPLPSGVRPAGRVNWNVPPAPGTPRTPSVATMPKLATPNAAVKTTGRGGTQETLNAIQDKVTGLSAWNDTLRRDVKRGQEEADRISAQRNPKINAIRARIVETDKAQHEWSAGLPAAQLALKDMDPAKPLKRHEGWWPKASPDDPALKKYSDAMKMKAGPFAPDPSMASLPVPDMPRRTNPGYVSPLGDSIKSQMKKARMLASGTKGCPVKPGEAFIAGDPQKDGKPNPELIVPTKQGTHVMPLKDMDKSPDAQQTKWREIAVKGHARTLKRKVPVKDHIRKLAYGTGTMYGMPRPKAFRPQITRPKITDPVTGALIQNGGLIQNSRPVLPGEMEEAQRMAATRAPQMDEPQPKRRRPEEAIALAPVRPFNHFGPGSGGAPGAGTGSGSETQAEWMAAHPGTNKVPKSRSRAFKYA